MNGFYKWVHSTVLSFNRLPILSVVLVFFQKHFMESIKKSHFHIYKDRKPMMSQLNQNQFRAP